MSLLNDIKVPEFLEHTKSPNYQLNVSSGATVNVVQDMIELSFFVDRVSCVREKFVAVDGVPGGVLPSGNIEVVPVREHVAALSLNLATLKALGELLSNAALEIEKQRRAQAQ
ncbi:hypothetical protein [Aeromonas sp. MR7]|uniref:hypothetical protein n=1 Tax=Aeromonas sp. MR7 TaxID=2923419 RepID=UPI001F4AC49F|nr:hypothetical protein [Aeromonas sp. MR7]MCH7348572.1 hypothetical protein [Aeromonas sp. MR7]